ncbi:hypothetical protein [Nitrosomonas sp.]|nr:hypothetical protein [Nitrosomonas sp.]
MQNVSRNKLAHVVQWFSRTLGFAGGAEGENAINHLLILHGVAG